MNPPCAQRASLRTPPTRIGSARATPTQIEAAIGSQHGVKRNDGHNTVRDHREQLRTAFLDAGVTRVSLGVQSFDSTVLERAGRSHSLRDVDESIAMLLNAHALHGSPLNSVSIDLIGGLPEQTMDTWQASLAAAA